MQRKLLALTLGLLMIAGLMGCASQSAPAATVAAPETTAPAASGTPAAAETAPAKETLEPITISVFTWLSIEEGWGAKSKADIKCFQELEKRTNVKVEWSIMSDTNTFDLMMSSGETPDVIWYSWLPWRQVKYANAGLIQDVSALVKENAPNVTKVLESNAKLKKQLVSPEGKMYLIPWVTTDKILHYSEGLSIRKDWLDKVGLPIPETNEDVYKALKAFRDQDANGNGKADEILTGYSDQLYKMMYGFGVCDGWQLAQDGKTAVYGPATEQYKAALKWFATLYKEGILDPDYLSRDGDLYAKKIMADQAAMWVDDVRGIGQYIKDGKANGLTIDFQPLGWLKYNGKRVAYYSTIKREAQHYGSCVSTKAKDPVRIVKWFDYMFGDEGSMLMNWGIEGESYKIVDGKPAYTEAVLNNKDYVSNIARSQYAEPTWCGPQSGEAELAVLDDLSKSFRTTWSDVDGSLAMEPYMFFSEADQAVVDSKQSNLTTEQNTWRDQFITGQKDIDKEWDAYLTALNGLGLPELVTAQQNALNTFMAQ